MLILSIDTTGFSSSIALVKNGNEVVFNRISSGFVPGKNWWDYPYLLPQFHQKFLLNNLKEINWKEIDAIAVSAKSGIFNCIVAGTSIAQTLGEIYQKPVIEIDHLLAHFYSTWLERNPNDFNFPVLIFSASGSHSDFALVRNKGRCEIIAGAVPKQDRGGVKTFLGIGKVFYQFGKNIGLIPSDDAGVSKLITATSKGNPNKFDFTKYYRGKLLDLDFSDFINSIEKEIKKKRKTPQLLNDMAASFQESITEILSDKIIKLAQKEQTNEIHIAGGISENKYLKNKLKDKIKEEKLPFVLRYPTKKQYRLDNAAMIGALAYYQKRYRIEFINFEPNVTK